jgi:hypothetical protein
VTSFLAGAIGGLDAAYDSQVLDAVSTFNHYVRAAHAAAAELRDAKRHPHEDVTTRSTALPLAVAAVPPTAVTAATNTVGVPIRRITTTTTNNDNTSAAGGATATTITAGPNGGSVSPKGGRASVAFASDFVVSQRVQTLELALNEAISAVHAAYEDIPLALRLLFAVDDSLMCLRSHSGAIECDSK